MAGLSVGIDSYITVDEADSIISNLFTSKSSELSTWNSLENSDKEVILRNSCYAIDKIEFKGSKKIRGQLLAFPRRGSVYPMYCVVPTLYRSQYYDNTFIKSDTSTYNNDGLDLVKRAQAVNAVYAALQSDAKVEMIKRVNSAIKSRSAASVSESYSDTIKGNNTANNIINGIYTDEVYTILKPWISNSVLSI